MTGRRVIVGVAVMGLATTSIAALLAELYGVASMRSVVVFGAIPAGALLIAAASSRHPTLADIGIRIRIGALGGVLGTIGYDLVRIPFAMAGMRVFSPIHSYGVLVAGSSHSTGWTDALGWLYHLSNGITFGIIYAVVAARRTRWLGVVWGLLLETAAVYGPFAGRYGLSGQTFAIVVAYGAHLAYGYPLGVVVEHYDSMAQWLRRSRFAVTTAIAVPAALIILAFRPWVADPALERALELRDRSGVVTAVIVGDRFRPEWLLIRSGECVAFVNEQDRTFQSSVVGAIGPGTTVTWCPAGGPKVHRIRLDDAPFSGGFVFVRD